MHRFGGITRHTSTGLNCCFIIFVVIAASVNAKQPSLLVFTDQHNTMNYTGPMFEYTPARATTTMRSAPRFGHSNDFSAVFSQSQDEQSDYLQGLVFAGAFILAIFIAWSVVLLILKCLGQYRVGFLSGNAFTTPGPRPFYIRIVFVTACICFIIFTVLCVTQGLTNIYSAVSVVGDSNAEVQSILQEAKGISLSLKSIGNSSAAIRDELSNNLGNFCPAEPDIETLTGVNFDALAMQAIDILNQLGDFIENDVSAMRDSISRALDTSETVENTVNDIQANDWQSLILLIPYLLLASLMLVGVTLAWYKKSGPIYTSAMSYAILPLFIVATVAAYSCSAFMAFSAIANADACSGGADSTPDGTVFSVLEQTGFDQSSYYYLAIQYYVSVILDYQALIETAATTVNDLSASLAAVTVESLNVFCGKDFGPFQGLLNTMNSNLSILNDNARDALGLMSCDRIVPIYINSVYGATCTYSVTGVTWTWASFLVIAFMGMLMITFRAAYLPDPTFDTDSISGVGFHKEYDHELTRPSSADSTPPLELMESREEDESIYIDGGDSIYIDGGESMHIDGVKYAGSFDEDSRASR